MLVTSQKVVVIRETLRQILGVDLASLVLSFTAYFPTTRRQSVSVKDMIESSRSWYDWINCCNSSNNEVYVSHMSWCSNGLLFVTNERLYLCADPFTRAKCLLSGVSQAHGWQDKIYCFQKTKDGDNENLVTLDDRGHVVPPCFSLEGLGHGMVVNDNKLFLFEEDNMVIVLDRHTGEVLREFTLPTDQQEHVTPPIDFSKGTESWMFDLKLVKNRSRVALDIIDLDQDGKTCKTLVINLQNKMFATPTLLICGNVIFACSYYWDHVKVYALSDGSFLKEILHGYFSGLIHVLHRESRLFLVDHENKLHIFE